MFSRNFRINRELFTTLHSSGVVVGWGNSESLSVKSYRLPDQTKKDRLKVAVVIGSKTAKRAVVRNRLKRRIRAIIYKHLTEIKQDLALIFWVKSAGLDRLPYLSLEEEVLSLLGRAKSLVLK